MDLQLAIIITLGIVILGVLVLCVFLGIENHWLKALGDTIEKAYKEALDKGLSGVELKAYVLQAIEDELHALGVPVKFLHIAIKIFVERIIHYKKKELEGK